jgi:hypothetical protein
VPGIQRPVDRAEPANDDELRTCRVERQFAKAEQGKRVRLHILLFFSLRLMDDASSVE